MIWKIDTYWLVMAVIVVSMLSYLFGYALDRIMENDGFGPTGNMIILVVCFFGGIYLANMYGIRFRSIPFAVAGGVTAGFIGLAFMALLKGLLYRTS